MVMHRSVVVLGMALSHLFTLVISSASAGVPASSARPDSGTSNTTTPSGNRYVCMCAVLCLLYQQCTKLCSKLSRTAGSSSNALNNTANNNADSNASFYGPNNPNPFLQSNVPAAGAKFVSRVLEKGGLPGTHTYIHTCIHAYTYISEHK